MTLRIFRKFQLKSMFFPQDIEFLKSRRLAQICHTNEVHLKTQYLKKRTLILAETVWIS